MRKISRFRLFLLGVGLAGLLAHVWPTSRAEAGCLRYPCMCMPDGSEGYCLRCFAGGTP
jgi:hypothetical protein